MDEGNKQGSGQSWSGLITVLLLFAGAVLVQQLPLHSSRPTEAAPLLRLFKNPQVVEARLWEDPFGAVARHEPSTKDQKSDTPTTPDGGNSFCNPSEDHGSAPSTVPTDILGVMVFGGDYEERREQRRRMRYAMVSGLLAAGLSPKDQEHIRYVHLPQMSDADARKSSPSNTPNQQTAVQVEPSYVPFEWFQSRDRWNESEEPNGRSVLLLWLDEDVYRERPLAKLDIVIGVVKQELLKKYCIRADTSVKIIGPASSGTLAAIFQEARGFQRAGLSARSSSTDPARSAEQTERMTKTPDTETPPPGDDTQDFDGPLGRCRTAVFGRIAEAIPAAGYRRYVRLLATAEIPGAAPEANLLNSPTGPQLIRTTSTDKALMKSVLAELELRGLNQACRDPGKCGAGKMPFDHIALVSEWDTEYGRRLPGALIAAQHERCHARVHAALPKGQCDSVEWVHLFAYLAGIDGTLPGAPHSDKSGAQSE